jgi:hypothetical protein
LVFWAGTSAVPVKFDGWTIDVSKRNAVAVQTQMIEKGPVLYGEHSRARGCSAEKTSTMITAYLAVALHAQDVVADGAREILRTWDNSRPMSARRTRNRRLILAERGTVQ